MAKLTLVEEPASTKTGDARAMARQMLTDIDAGVSLGLAYRYACECFDAGVRICFGLNMADQAKKMGIAMINGEATEVVLRALVEALPCE